AHKYGLRIYFDLHTIPGSHSGYNHSGTLGKVNVLNVIMGIADVQRRLYYIRIVVEFIRQPEYIDGIPIFRIMNGALGENDREGPAHIFVRPPSLFCGNSRCHFASYLEAHNSIPSITGYGRATGPSSASTASRRGRASSLARTAPSSTRTRTLPSTRS
ncbi:hypothetical protein B0H11DRAFT_1743032, partial [Mycena galericulata]